MTEKVQVKPRIASINLTNAIPKRVSLICNSLQGLYLCDYICWDRFEVSSDESAHLIEARNTLAYVFRLYLYLRKRNYYGIIFDDLRLLPLLYWLSITSQTKLIYNRQEIPTVTIAGKLISTLKFPKTVAYSIARFYENLIATKLSGVITIPIVDKEKMHLIRWGKPILEVSNYPSNSNLPGLSQKSESPFVFVYSGALREETGLLLYLEFIHILSGRNPGRDLKLVLVGHIWDKSRENIQGIITEKRCESLVELRPWMPYAELQQLYRKSHVALAYADPDHPKYSLMKSGCSRKIFTYMAAGLPVVAGGAFSDIIRYERTGIRTEFGDIDEMTSAGQFYIDNYDKVIEQGLKGIKLIKSKYSWESQLSELRSFFQRCFAE